jgi:hypothetical protein
VDYDIIPDEEALGQCASCGGRITDEMEVFGIGVKLRQGVELSEYEGHCIQISLAADGKPAFMLVTDRDSDARKDGNDGMMICCSEACGSQLKTALEKEISMAGMFELIQLNRY